jgi:rod shape-determining protein MreC
MQNILRFILHYHFFILFLVLEIISFSFIIKNNFNQRATIINSANNLTGGILNKTSSVKDFFSLYEINQQLVKENALLKSMHKSSFIFDKRDKITINDVQFNRKYTYIPAKVISNSINYRDNYITLNVGSKDSVKEGMGVVSPNGVVGFVKNVSKNYSTVYSLLNSKSKISGKVGVEDVIGTVVWSEKNYQKAKFIDISKYHEIKKGDTIFSNDYSITFPPNIPIAYIDTFYTNEKSDFYEIDVKYANNFSNVSNVYVIIINKSEEQKELENLIQKDE